VLQNIPGGYSQSGGSAEVRVGTRDKGRGTRFGHDVSHRPAHPSGGSRRSGRFRTFLRQSSQSARNITHAYSHPLVTRHPSPVTRHASLFKTFSIFSNSSIEKSGFLSAARLSCNCSTELAPIRTEVTRLSFSNQTMAISAKV